MLASELIKNAPDIEIEQLSTDSRMPMKNAIFFCVKGVRYDGHDYVKEAIINGAVLIVYEDEIDTDLNAVFVKVNNVFNVLIQITNKFYNYPSKDIDSFVISGCYGRSSVAYYINQLLNNYKNCASVGIMGINYNGKTLSSSYATLPILSNASYLDAMRKDGVKACTFETNPLNISLRKIDIVNPKVFVYTNTSYDAQDYKELNIDYFDSLRKYFYTLDNETWVVLNKDDMSYNELYDSVGKKVTYGFDEDADFQIYDYTLENDSTSFALKFNGQNALITTNLLSLSNIYNLVASIAALVVYGYDFYEITSLVKNMKNVEGVIDRIDNDKYIVIVDNAYCLDSIENILSFGKDIIKNKKNKLVVLLGIKFTDDNRRIESIMKICEKYVDRLIITEDDSYEHNTLSILNNVSNYQGNNKMLIIEDRINAIEEGIELLNTGDVFLILGKGNENIIYKGLGKEYYEGDKKIAIKYLKVRMEDEYETF